MWVLFKLFFRRGANNNLANMDVLRRGMVVELCIVVPFLLFGAYKVWSNFDHMKTQLSAAKMQVVEEKSANEGKISKKEAEAKDLKILSLDSQVLTLSKEMANLNEKLSFCKPASSEKAVNKPAPVAAKAVETKKSDCNPPAVKKPAKKIGKKKSDLVPTVVLACRWKSDGTLRLKSNPSVAVLAETVLAVSVFDQDNPNSPVVKPTKKEKNCHEWRTRVEKKFGRIN